MNSVTFTGNQNDFIVLRITQGSFLMPTLINYTNGDYIFPVADTLYTGNKFIPIGNKTECALLKFLF